MVGWTHHGIRPWDLFPQYFSHTKSPISPRWVFVFHLHVHILAFKKCFNCIFPLLFNPLISTPSFSHHTVVHVHEPFVLFAQSFHPLKSPASIGVIWSLSMNLSLLSLLAQFVHLTPHEWDHMVFVFLWLAYFT